MVAPSPRLNIVRPPAAAAPTLAERIARLQAEARVLAGDQVETMLTSLAELGRLSAEIADGGEAYPVGVREIARRVAADAENTAASINAIRSRR